MPTTIRSTNTTKSHTNTDASCDAAAELDESEMGYEWLKT